MAFLLVLGEGENFVGEASVFRNHRAEVGAVSFESLDGLLDLVSVLFAAVQIRPLFIQLQLNRIDASLTTGLLLTELILQLLHFGIKLYIQRELALELVDLVSQILVVGQLFLEGVQLLHQLGILLIQLGNLLDSDRQLVCLVAQHFIGIIAFAQVRI